MKSTFGTKILSIILCLCIIGSVIPMSVIAQGTGAMTPQEALDSISLPTTTKVDLNLPTIVGGNSVTWTTSCEYAIDTTGKVSYDSFWYEFKNPVTLTATIGELTKTFQVEAVMPVIDRYEVEEVGYDYDGENGWLDLYVKIAGYEAGSTTPYYFDFNELADETVTFKHTGFEGTINSFDKMPGFTDATSSGSKENVFYERFALGLFDENLTYNVNCTIGVNGTTYYYEMPEFTIENKQVTSQPLQFVTQSVSRLDTIYVDSRLGTSNDEYDYTTLSADYANLSDAVAAAKDGDTIKLLNDITLSSQIAVDKAITLDLNGKTLTAGVEKQFLLNSANANLTVIDSKAGGKIVSSEDRMFYVQRGTLNLQSGTYISNGYWEYDGVNYGYDVIGVVGSTDSTASNYSVINIEKAAVLKDESDTSGGYGISIYQNSTSSYGVVVNVKGTIDTRGVSVYINGTVQQTTGNVPVINISDGAVLNGMIYAAGYAKWNISDSTIKGDTGIEIRAGELNVLENADIKGTAVPTTVTPNGNGSSTDGAGIGVAQHNTKLPIKVNISGGKISGYTALYQSNPQNNAQADINKVAITVTGGKFSTVNGGTNDIYTQNNKVTVSGGYFTSDVVNCLVAGKRLVASDISGYNYMVQDSANDVVVSIGTPSVAPAAPSATQDVKDAVDAITSGEVVSNGLGVAANGVANENTTTEQAANDALADANITVGDNEVAVVVQPYFEIDVKDCNIDGANSYLTLDISPKYNILATVDKDNIDVGTNAAVIESGKDLKVTTPVTLSIAVPADFPTANVFIKHIKDDGSVYYYKATVINGMLTFTTTHGFSEFEAFVNEDNLTINFTEGVDDEYKVSDIGATLPVLTRENYVFAGWSFEGVEGTYTTLTKELFDALVEKYGADAFAPTSVWKCTITATAGEGGAISPSGDTLVLVGAGQTYTITADEGYAVSDVLVNGVSVGAKTSYAFENVTENQTISVEFELIDNNSGETEKPGTDYTSNSLIYTIMLLSLLAASVLVVNKKRFLLK